jgi:hypothetical protein
MTQQGLQHPEGLPTPTEYDFRPQGVEEIANFAIADLVHYADHGGHAPMQPDGVTFDLDQARRNIALRAAAVTRAVALDTIFPRTDGRRWQAALEESAAQARSAETESVAE